VRPSDEDLDEIRKALERKDAKTWEQLLACKKKKLNDGLYVVRTRSDVWCLSIYRNVIEASNDVEIALNYQALGSAEELPAAKRWVEATLSDLEYGPSGVHKDNESTTHRSGMKLNGVREFVRRLVTELQAEGKRWEAPSAAVEGLPAEPSLVPAEATRAPPELVPVLKAMLLNSRAACEQSNRETVTVGKRKLFHFDSDEDFYAYVVPLLQPLRCAITGLALDASMADPDLAPSLDRKNSGQHYEPGNLQVVARFVNRWKSDDSDENFRRLLKFVSARE
jgi:hypothetical protein